ncbi:Similar to phosphoglycolate phosphatase, clustered with ribosomal large subunit pseudouridine synthase C [hydrothermal vent metagenome]|uniref:Similar to phosphoglycolate phosphatase, clustered with ribosomal large subunit pseudouridine synthase C n=1 Tax=hydrothermal vent metagenome TaxID=652676 RepID=A0A3B1B0W6_9ZZZZ
MQKNFKLLVFDWDGTLMDSEARIVNCMRAAITELELALPDDGSISNIIGLGLKEAICMLIPGADDQLVKDITKAYRQHYLFECSTPTPLFEGAEEALLTLESQGYLLAVATGKGRKGLNRVLDGTGLARLFHATCCADEAFSKPHPDMLLQIMEELGVDAADTLMIGDTEYDMQMASSAGSAALAVSYGVHGVDRLMQHGPLGCLDAISEITDWLNE